MCFVSQAYTLKSQPSPPSLPNIKNMLFCTNAHFYECIKMSKQIFQSFPFRSSSIWHWIHHILEKTYNPNPSHEQQKFLCMQYTLAYTKVSWAIRRSKRGNFGKCSFLRILTKASEGRQNHYHHHRLREKSKGQKCYIKKQILNLRLYFL